MNGRIIPTKRQLEFLDWEFGVFFHFGIRSFYPGHKDWDNRPMDAEAFNPEQLDCEQWIRTAGDAGARYAILVCKHHDGFANWPTKYSGYSVAATPWKDGKGDVVREFVDACRKYGLKVGLYYSPAQWGGKTAFKDGREYDDYFINQIGELLSGYGKIDYLWFDGCGSEGHRYDETRIIAAIREMQPEILIFNMWDPDTLWVGNEDGYAPLYNPCERQWPRQDSDAGKRFLPAECDMRMRSTWFDCEANEDTVKSVAELMGIYEMSVGRGANLLLNVGPDSRGLIPERDAQRLLEFGQEIRRCYGKPLEAFSEPVRTENGYAIRAEDNVLVNRLMLSEDLTQGESISEFEVYARLPESKDQLLCVWRGCTVGHKAICAFPAIKTSELTVEVRRSRGEHRLKDMKAYFVE